jgi:hypothetical protein
MNAPPPTRAEALFKQANQPVNGNQVGFWAKYKWWIIGLVVILAIVGGVLGGVSRPKASIHIRSCAGGTAGVGTNKEKGCLCNSGSECTSGMCSTSATTLAAGASQGKCA